MPSKCSQKIAPSMKVTTSSGLMTQSITIYRRDYCKQEWERSTPLPHQNRQRFSILIIENFSAVIVNCARSFAGPQQLNYHHIWQTRHHHHRTKMRSHIYARKTHRILARENSHVCDTIILNSISLHIYVQHCWNMFVELYVQAAAESSLSGVNGSTICYTASRWMW